MGEATASDSRNTPPKPDVLEGLKGDATGGSPITARRSDSTSSSTLFEGRAPFVTPTTAIRSSNIKPVMQATAGGSGPALGRTRSRPVESSFVRGSSQLEKVRSSEIAMTAEGVVAGSQQTALAARQERDRIEQLGNEVDDEKTVGESGKGSDKSEDDDWTYPDGGLTAWGVVFGCFIIACCQNGYGVVWGVLSQNLREGAHKGVPLSTLNLVIGLQNFCMLGGSLVTGRLGDRFGYKLMIAIGLVLTTISLILSAVTYKSLPCLFIFQGAALGMSQSISMPLTMSLPSQWFLKRRGIATGFAVSGAGVGGGIGSLILRAMLPPLGYRGTLLAYAGINLGLCIGAFFLLKTREPPLVEGQSRVPKKWLPKGIWNDIAIYSMLACLGISIWGFLCTFYFIIAYTTEKCPQFSATSLQPALPLVLLNLMSAIGRVIVGFTADSIGPVNALFLTFFFAGLLQLVFWPFAETYSQIMAFSALYGLLGTSFLSLIPASAAQFFLKTRGTAGFATICGLCVISLAPGQFLGSTVAGFILSSNGGKYLGVMMYGGATLLGGSFLLLPARFSRERRIFVAF